MHEEVTSAIGIKCCFARPYASWQRGANEHVSGIIRWYLPKGTDFSKITDKQITRIGFLIKNRPRKCRGFKKPIEAAAPFVALRG